jgi:TRAP-type C4-dicarboxylate transport system substrate-binding protein
MRPIPLTFKEETPMASNVKTLAVFILSVFALSTFVSNSYAQDKKGKQYKFKLASLAPKAMGWARHVREIAHPYLKEGTNDGLKIKWYWGGVMGNDKDYIQKMKIGQLHGGAFTGQGSVLVVPEMGVVELPFLFNNYDEVDYIKEKISPSFDSYAEKRGYKIIVWADQDFDQIYSANFKMETLEDFPKTRFLTWYGPLEQMVLKKLGASPIPVNVTEITPSIRQGVADTLIAPAIWVLGAQLYTTMKYVNPVKIRYSPVTVIVTTKAFNSIPEDYQKVVMGLRGDTSRTICGKIREDNKKSYDAMINKAGLKEATMSPEVLDQMREKCKEVWYEAAGKEFPKELLDEVLAHLKDFRAMEKK